MRLYPRDPSAASVDHDGARYEPGEDGGFDFPDELGAQMHSCHVGGKPAWETHAERDARRAGEELERRRDPAALLAAVELLATPGPAAAGTESRTAGGA
jgi:hypothetical protein